MTNLHTEKMTMETLSDLLDQYGGDTSRMPAQTAAAIEELVARSDEAREMLQQARALDKALSANRREVNWDISALESRILEAAFTGEARQNNASIINLSDHKPLAGQPVDDSKVQATPTTANSVTAPLAAANDNRWSSRMAASGLLAASLLFGVFFGAFGGANMLIGEQSELTLASTDVNTVLTDDIFDLGTEFSLDASNGTSN